MAAEPDADRTEANARDAEASAQPLLREALAKIEAAADRLGAPADARVIRLLERIEDEAGHDLGSLAATLGEWDSPEDEAAWRDL